MTNEKLDVIDRRVLFSNGSRFISIEPKVGVNYGGTVLMKEVLDFRESGYISFEEDTDPNFTGLSMTPQEFADEELEETQKFRGMQL